MSLINVNCKLVVGLELVWSTMKSDHTKRLTEAHLYEVSEASV
jgi:hypothetical protein